jgi:hypothetical protein
MQSNNYGLIFWNQTKNLIFFSSFVIEESIETLVYDFGGFLAALGGNMGLALGFSCMSLLFSVLNLFNDFILRME